MKEVVEIIAKALVDKPEEVVVNETLEGEDTIIELSVAQDDVGKVIGKSGKIAKAIRSLVKAAASKAGKRVTVVIN
jgi:RNA-binding protein